MTAVNECQFLLEWPDGAVKTCNALETARALSVTEHTLKRWVDVATAPSFYRRPKGWPDIDIQITVLRYFARAKSSDDAARLTFDREHLMRCVDRLAVRSTPNQRVELREVFDRLRAGFVRYEPSLVSPGRSSVVPRDRAALLDAIDTIKAVQTSAQRDDLEAAYAALYAAAASYVPAHGGRGPR